MKSGLCGFRRYGSCVGISIICLLVLWLGNISAHAAGPATQPSDQAPPPRNPGMSLTAAVHRIRGAIEKLDLTDDQKPKIAAIFDKAEADAKAMADDLATLSPQERMGRIAPFLKDLRQQVGDVLTDEQKQQIRTLMSQRPVGDRMIGRVKDALAKIDLSDDQKKQVQQLMDECQAKAQELRQAMGRGEDVSAQVRDAIQHFRDQIGQILTPEQHEQFQKLMVESAATQMDESPPPPPPSGPPTTQPGAEHTSHPSAATPPKEPGASAVTPKDAPAVLAVK